MKSRNKLFSLFAIVLMISCSQENIIENIIEKVDFKNLNYPELVAYYLVTQDSAEIDSIIKFLDDSIQKYSDYSLQLFEKPDTIENKLVLSARLFDEFYGRDVCIKQRNVYNIFINRKDEILAGIVTFHDTNFMEVDLTEFIINSKNSYQWPEKKLRVINLLDTVKVSTAGFFIFSQINPDSLTNRTSWKQLKNVINKITKTYYSLRNDSAHRIWGTSYYQLELNKQLALSEYIPIRIMIFPNVDHEIPPPPPPIPIDYSLDNDFSNNTIDKSKNDEIESDNPISVISRIFTNYIKYDESTDSPDNLDALTIALKQLEKKIEIKDLELIINVWMYYTVTDFPTQELTEKVFFAHRDESIKAVKERMKNKMDWEKEDGAPFSELEYLLTKLEENR
ncbi:MAG: hypothetical protein K9J13_10215 [Saprospiraceae bacterium]|nr:hypothetical protein [Saprospiraceae bacterium]